ncbi:MAG: DNA polymerase III subunit epsilon [Legionellaceae bacterium]|nr:DNA polymerase III subunit epsilon [Legionellaceae bacterium]
MRQVVLDTETTGLDPIQGHKIIEIGCVELLNRKRTGRHFHTYLNPKRAVDEGAFRVHGLSNNFLEDKPLFKERIEDLLAFIEGAELVIHNASFDMGFLNAEFLATKWPKSVYEYVTVLDTLVLARAKHPGQRNNLDALCKRYGIQNTHRRLHGALLDAEILVDVYLAMTGGQIDFFAQEEESASEIKSTPEMIPSLLANAITIPVSEEERVAHEAYMQRLLEVR